MMYLGDKAVGINHTNILAHGTYIPETDGSYFDIDTGITGWKYFLIIPRKLPYDEAYVRCFGQMFVSVDANYALFTYGPSSSSTNPNGASVSTLGGYYNLDGSIVKKRGIAAQTGSLKSNIEYDWYCW